METSILRTFIFTGKYILEILNILVHTILLSHILIHSNDKDRDRYFRYSIIKR